MQPIDINQNDFIPQGIYSREDIEGLENGWRPKPSKDNQPRVDNQGREYEVYTKNIDHPEISWRICQGLKAFFATICFKGRKTVSDLWQQAITGRETRKIKVLSESESHENKVHSVGQPIISQRSPSSSPKIKTDDQIKNSTSTSKKDTSHLSTSSIEEVDLHAQKNQWNSCIFLMSPSDQEFLGFIRDHFPGATCQFMGKVDLQKGKIENIEGKTLILLYKASERVDELFKGTSHIREQSSEQKIIWALCCIDKGNLTHKENLETSGSKDQANYIVGGLYGRKADKNGGFYDSFKDEDKEDFIKKIKIAIKSV